MDSKVTYVATLTGWHADSRLVVMFLSMLLFGHGIGKVFLQASQAVECGLLHSRASHVPRPQVWRVEAKLRSVDDVFLPLLVLLFAHVVLHAVDDVVHTDGERATAIVQHAAHVVA